MRKTRGDSILLSQPAGVREAIYRLETEEGLTIEQIQQRLALPLPKGFGIDASQGTISVFLRTMRTEAFRDRLQRRAAHATEIEDAIDDDDRARIDQGILDGLREIIFDTVASGEITAKDAKALVGLILKSKEQAMDERKLALLEKKAEAYDQLKNDANADDGLTPEERLAKIREGLKV